VVVLAALVLAGGVVSAAAQETGAGPSAQGKKRCKIVKKKVHGKVRKVRVCHTVKPKPKPTVKSVSITLETSNAAVKPIAAADGGTITVTAGAGTKLTLTIPKDALLADTTVTITPVASVSGLPAGSRFLGGVQLAPEGTALAKDATLTVETPAAASAKSVRAIAWQGTGKTPVSYPATRTGSSVQIKVIHFSGYGADDGPSIPSNWPDVFRAAYPRIHQQMVQATTTDSVDFARNAISDWLGWERQLQLLGADDFMTNERRELQQELLPKVIKNMIDKSYERCKNQHDVAEELAFLRGVQRQAQLLGLDNLSDLAQSRVEQCASFELDFESVITWRTPDGSSTSDVRIQGLKLNAENGWTNEKTLEYFRFDFLPEVDPSPCTLTTSTRADEPFRAKLLSFGRPAESLPKPNVMEVFVGKVTEIVTITCPDGGTSGPSGFWNGGIAVLHNSWSFTIDDWDYVGTSLFARKTYSRSMPTGDSSVSEQTTFDLRHTPE